MPDGADSLSHSVKRRVNKKTRILVVEDEEAIRTGLVDVLVFHGYEVESANDGVDGRDKALHGKFDLVVLDIMLPGASGFDVCNALRRVNKDIAIIMLTARVSDEDIVKGLELGADDYVAKPFSIAQLLLRIKAVLRRSRNDEEHQSRLALGGGLEIDAAATSQRDSGARDDRVHSSRDGPAAVPVRARRSPGGARGAARACVGLCQSPGHRNAYRRHSHREAAAQDRDQPQRAVRLLTIRGAG